jgi:prepilin signal peptidase PulO-like enzyme (type II secretory pathway)
MSASTPIHKYVPELLFLLGLLFVAFALYMSREFAMSYWYIGVGVAFGIYGVGIDFFRLHYAKPDQSPRMLVHNRIAELMFLLGLLFIAFALYMHRELAFSFRYVGIGLAFCIYGVGIDFVRVQRRKSYPAPSLQTIEAAE